MLLTIILMVLSCVIGILFGYGIAMWAVAELLAQNNIYKDEKSGKYIQRKAK